MYRSMQVLLLLLLGPQVQVLPVALEASLGLLEGYIILGGPGRDLKV